MSHQIKLEDLQDWLDENPLLLFARSTKGKKAFYANINGSFEIHFKGKVVRRTMQPFDALEKYNSL